MSNDFPSLYREEEDEEVVTPLMLDGTYLSRNFATLEPWITAAMCFLFLGAAV